MRLSGRTTSRPPRQAHGREGPLITARTSVTAVLIIIIIDSKRWQGKRVINTDTTEYKLATDSN